MAPRFRNRLALLTLAAALSAGTVTPAVFADDAVVEDSSQAAVDTPSIGSVSIGADSSIELKRASVLTGDDGKVVAFTITIHNESDQELQFIDYWVRLLGEGGAKFTVNINADDKSKNKIPPHSSMDVGFYSKVNSTTELSDLTFRFIKWDFSAADYERNLGDITIPDDYSTVTPLGNATLFPVLGTTMKASIGKLVVNRNDDYYLSTAYVNVENVGMKSGKLDSAKYSYAIQTPEGYVYSLTEAPDSKDVTLAPRVKKELRLNASIPTAVTPDGWQLLVIQQGTDATLKLPVAVFELPSATSGDGGATPSESVSVDVNGTPVTAKISRVSIGKTDANYLTSVYFQFQNDGSKSVTLPAYQLALLNEEGLSYPLTSSTDLSKLTLTPRSSKEVQLSVSIPTSVSIDNMKLQLIQPGSDDKFNYPVATFNVPKATTSDVSIGVAYPFTDNNGAYSAKLSAIQRMPLDAQDLLAADLELGNQGDTLLSLPTLQGYFLLDGTVKVDANLQLSDKVNSITGKSSVHYSLVGGIPYTTSFKDIKLVLQESDSNGKDAAFQTVAEFKNNADLLAMPVIDKGKEYNLTGIGRQAGIKVANVNTYAGAVDNLYYMELEVQNLEKRFTKLAELKGYIKTKDDMYYPATITKVTNAVSPKAIATVALYSALPKDYAIGDLSIVLGESAKLTASATESDGYVRAVNMRLPDENTTVKNATDALAFNGYTLTLSNIKAVQTFGVSGVPFNINFDYKLEKGNVILPELSDKKHKLIMVISDSESRKIEQEIELTTGAGGTAKLTVGTGTNSIPLKDSDPEFLVKAIKAGSYTFSLYDDFDGYRKLLSSGSYNWIGN